jgi:large subunit ribosomal protein L23
MSQAATPKEVRRERKLLPHQVILRPLVTEKGMHRATRNNQYAFEVNPLAEKVDVREAVESLFNV